MEMAWRGGEVCASVCARVCMNECVPVCVRGGSLPSLPPPSAKRQETGAKSNFSSQVTRLSIQPSFKLSPLSVTPIIVFTATLSNVTRRGRGAPGGSHLPSQRAPDSLSPLSFPDALCASCLINPTDALTTPKH